MALVAYDYDSNSGSEEDDEDNNVAVSSDPDASSTRNEINNSVDTEVVSSSNLFSSLPTAKAITNSNANNNDEDVIEDFIPKSKPIKEKQKVKITIPSLSQFKSIDDDDDDNKTMMKKLKLSNKGSGLISMLPPVRGTPLTATSFVPKVIANKNKSTNSLVPNAVRKKAEAKKSSMLKKVAAKKTRNPDSESDDDDDIEMPESFDDDMWQKVCGRPKPKPVLIQPEEPEFVPDNVNIAPEPEEPYEGLDNAAFKELVGKTKRPLGNIKLIDLNEEEILPEKDVWMTKSLTDPECAPKPSVENPVDPTRRKRHHITYLAQQAKANEQELANQWSASKNNRLATRAKYGF